MKKKLFAILRLVRDVLVHLEKSTYYEIDNNNFKLGIPKKIATYSQ